MATIQRPTISRIVKMTEFDLLRTKVEMGNMYMCVDTQKMYYDGGNTADSRAIYDYISVRTVNDLMYNITPSFGKSYYCWEDNSLWIWVNKWETLYADTTYPSAYVYDDTNSLNSVYRYDMPNYPADDNGLLKDGSVVVRDRNRIIKGKIYVDDGNDNFVISSFLGGGLRFLPNGKMSTEGELYICDDTDTTDDSEIETEKQARIELSSSETNVEITSDELLFIQDEFTLNDCKAPQRFDLESGSYTLSNTPDDTEDIYIAKYTNTEDESKYFTVVQHTYYVPVNGKIKYSYIRSELHTMNNDLYVDFSEDPDKDNNVYQKPSHKYKVYHEGNLDVSSIKIMSPLQIYNKLMEKDTLPNPFDFNVLQLDGHTSDYFAQATHTHESSDITDLNDFVSRQAGIAVRSIFNNMEGLGITGSYNTASDVLRLEANNFNIALSGGVTGNATVSNLTDTVINVTVDPTKHIHTNYEETLTSLQNQINALNIDATSTYTRAVIDEKIAEVTGTSIPTPNKPLLVNMDGILPGTSTNATKLNHDITFTFSGNVTGDITINGSETNVNVPLSLNLADTGIPEQIDEQIQTRFYMTTIGDDASISFAIRHGLGSEHVMVQCRDVNTKQQVYLDNIVLDENRIQIDSTSVLATNSVEVYVIKID